MRKFLFALAATLLTQAAAAQTPQTISNTGVLLDRIVAVVNEGIILQSQMDAKVQLIAGQIRQAGGQMPPRETIEQQVLEQLIVQEVQLQRVKLPTG